MKAKKLTPLQRIEILEDVLKKLESGDTEYGLCDKITRSTFELFDISDIWEIPSQNIIPILTLENARKVTEVIDGATEGGYWWYSFYNYDFENRIKFVKWMIEQEKEFLK